MKLAAIPKSPLKHTNDNQLNAKSKHRHKSSHKTTNAEPPPSTSSATRASKMLAKKTSRRESPSSNSSYCSACTESDDDSDTSSLASGNKRSAKGAKSYRKQNNDKQRRSTASVRSVTRKKVVASVSSESNSDSDDSSDVTERIKKHTPTKSPAQQRKFTKSDVPIPVGIANQNLADGASSSDNMEIPALVRAAIQCVESGSDVEHAKTETNPHRTQYTSSLLQDFVAKTQALGTSLTNVDKILSPTKSDDATKKSSTLATSATKSSNVADVISDDAKVKKKRPGRPRKNPIDPHKINQNNSESPDSGITSTPQSPVPSKSSTITANHSNSTTVPTAAAKKATITVTKKLDISALDKTMYATERVLYPPRRKKPAAPSQLTTANVSRHTQNADRVAEVAEKVDPVWRKIDINKKFRRPSECGYRSDTNTICSKVLAKQSGYTSDYANVRRISSGYKSDYSVKAKSCGYRSDCSTKRRKIRRKRRTKTATATKQPTINDQDLLMFAGLSLGKSDDSSSDDSQDKPEVNANASRASINPTNPPRLFAADCNVSFGQRSFIQSSSNERDTKYATETEKLDRSVPAFNPSLATEMTSSIYKDSGEFAEAVKSERMKPGSIRRRRSSAVSHCSSHCSTNSRHPLRRRRRRRLKSITDFSEAQTQQLSQDIEQLSSSFTTQCNIFADKNVREKDRSSTAAKASTSKRGAKKRKTNVEVAETSLPSTSTAPAPTKRRNKKAVQTKSPDDHKLPLKKRHYLMSTSGEKAETARNATDDERENAAAEPGNRVAGKAVTPKKRHLLQTPVDLNDALDSTDATSSSTCKDLQETQAAVSLSITGETSTAKAATTQAKKNDINRKKSRLEGLVLKISPTTSNSAEPTYTATLVNKSPSVQKNLTTKSQPSKNLTTKGQPTPTTKGQPTLTTKGQPTLTTKGQPNLTTKGQPNLTTKGQPSPTTKGQPNLTAKGQPILTTKGQPNSTTKEQPNLATKGQPKKTLTTKAQPTTPKSSSTAKQTTPAPLDPSPKTSARASSNARNHNNNNNKSNQIPPGVFEPSIDVELQIPFTEIPIRPMRSMDDVSQSTSVTEPKGRRSQTKPDCVVEKLLHRTGATVAATPTPPPATSSTPVPKKKRKKPNRTGFPSVKKKKKPAPKPKVDDISMVNGDSSAVDPPTCSAAPETINALDALTNSGDGTSIQRNAKPRLMVVSLERLQGELIENGTHAIDKRNKGTPASTDLTIAEDDAEMSGISSRRHATKSTDTASGRKSRAMELEPIPSGRRGRSAANTPQIDEAKSAAPSPLPTRATKVTKTPASSKTADIGPITELIERSDSKKKSRRSSIEVISRCGKKRTNGTKGSDSEADKAVKGSKRSHNGKVVDASRNSILPLHELIDTVDNVKSSKRARHDISGTENKPKNHKRPLANHDGQQENVKSKKPRVEMAREITKTPPAKKKSNQKIYETITSYDDIPPVEEWVENSAYSDEPLPLDENVNGMDCETELVPTIEREVGKRSRTKKRYLVAGLFSNYYKEDHPIVEKVAKSSNGTDKKTANQQPDEPLNGTLLPMPFYAKQIMHAQIDFQLPYDLWYAYENDKLPPRVQSWTFKKIRINSYSDSVKPQAQSSDLSQCSCKPDYACGEMCLNRLVYTECDPETCPCGVRCENTSIQRHIVARTERFMTEQKGWGVRAQEIIKKGTYILEYVGEVVTELEFKERMHTVYTNDIHHYCLHLDKGLFIDGHRMGSDCRFVNHSCEPNCEMQKWSVNGLPRMALFAMGDIEPGQELTYDYNFSLFNPAEGQVCKCGSKECRGVIGGKSQRVRPLENKVSFGLIFISFFHYILFIQIIDEIRIFYVSREMIQRKAVRSILNAVAVQKAKALCIQNHIIRNAPIFQCQVCESKRSLQMDTASFYGTCER